MFEGSGRGWKRVRLSRVPRARGCTAVCEWDAGTDLLSKRMLFFTDSIGALMAVARSLPISNMTIELLLS